MTACEMAASGSEALALGALEVSKSLQLPGLEARGGRSAVSLFLLDVVTGVRCVSHSALATLGLVAVLVAAFLMGRADMRHDLETHALNWLMERANVRANEGTDEADDEAQLLAMAEPEAIQRATAINPSVLNRQQAAVAYWIARRYSVAPEPIGRLVQEAWSVAPRVNMDPTLVLAVMAIESGFNPFAQSHVGAQGLMQVMTRIHQDKYQIFGGQNAAFDPVTNLRVGVQVLKDCIRRAGSIQGGLKYYVGAANMVDDGGYAAKVMAEQAYLHQVAAGVKVPVTAPLVIRTVVQADAPVAESATVVPAPVALPAPANLPVAAPLAPSLATPLAPAKAGSAAVTGGRAIKAAKVAVPPSAPGASGGALPTPPLPVHRSEQVAMLTAVR